MLVAVRFLPLLALPIASCAGSSAAPAAAATPKYPRRRPGCKLAVYAGPKPEGAKWDDLGVAEVGCHIETSKPECLARLRAEACRMGGDILYDMPKKPNRPYEQALVYRARVAHSRAPEGKPEKEPAPKPGEEPPPPATPEESAGPVIPLGTPAPAALDAGVGTDAGAPETAAPRFF